MYVDTDSGTVLNGPIVWLDDEYDVEGLPDSDVIDAALTFGEPVGRLLR